MVLTTPLSASQSHRLITLLSLARTRIRSISNNQISYPVAMTNVLPSGENATEKTVPLSMFMETLRVPALRARIRSTSNNKISLPVVMASVFPSGENATEWTQVVPVKPSYVKPSMVVLSAPLSASHNRTVFRSPLIEAIVLPSGANTTEPFGASSTEATEPV